VAAATPGGTRHEYRRVDAATAAGAMFETARAEVSMIRSCSTLIAAAALLASAGPLHAQSAGPAPQAPALSFASRATAPAPDKISLLTVENHLPEVAGMYIAMEPILVEKVKSPRLFTVGERLYPSHYMEDEHRTLVLLASPAPQLGPGALVEVTGWVTTLATARQAFPGEWGADPGTNGNRAVIVANVVRAVDGAELASR
jgi:hypothetical protein